jgi:hypothetical protein
MPPTPLVGRIYSLQPINPYTTVRPSALHQPSNLSVHSALGRPHTRYYYHHHKNTVFRRCVTASENDFKEGAPGAAAAHSALSHLPSIHLQLTHGWLLLQNNETLWGSNPHTCQTSREQSGLGTSHMHAKMIGPGEVLPDAHSSGHSQVRAACHAAQRGEDWRTDNGSTSRTARCGWQHGFDNPVVPCTAVAMHASADHVRWRLGSWHIALLARFIGNDDWVSPQ